MVENLVLKLGDFKLVALDSPNLSNPLTKTHLAFVRYDGMMPRGNSSILVFEIGGYDWQKKNTSGNPIYFPAGEKRLECRVDGYGRKVTLVIMEATPMRVVYKDVTERQSAVED